MSSTFKLGGAATGPIAPVIDTSNNAKTPNHGINLTSHLNSQHAPQNNTEEVILNPNSNVHSSTISPTLTLCPPVKANTENITNCSSEKTNIQSPVAKPPVDKIDDKKLSPNITKINSGTKTDASTIVESKTSEAINSVKNNLNNVSATIPVNPVKPTNEIVNNVTSTKTTEDEKLQSTEASTVNAKEQYESPKNPTQASNNVSSSTNSPSNVVSSSTTAIAADSNVPTVSVKTTISTSVQLPENRTPIKPASTMKLATVSSRSHIKRKRDLKTNTNSKKNIMDNTDIQENHNDQKSKRARVKTQPYQSPLPEFAMITKLSANLAKNKANDDKLIIFYKNEFLAVRNSEGSFYVCQAMQNVYKSSPKIRIRWLSQIKEDASGETYSPDFYDFTDFDCILTNLNLNRLDKGLYKLPGSELERTQSILQRALNVEQGISSQLDITEEHPDGLDLSLYRDEAQLDNKKTRKISKRKKIRTNGDEGKTSRDPLRSVSSKSKHLKKTSKKKKTNKSSTLQAVKLKATKSKTIAKKINEAASSSKSVESNSKARQVRAIVVMPSTSKAKSGGTISKRKAQDPLKIMTNLASRTKNRSAGRNTTTSIATTSRSARGLKSMKETRRGHK